jgi:6-phospho-beta-glucosidase
MRIAIVGAGGFRTPLIHGVLLDAQERLGISEVVLHDDDAERIRRILPVLDGLAAERGRQLPVRVETDLDVAVSGARFVLCAIRVGGLAGRVVDETVPLEHGVLGQETVGPGGIAFALRTLPAMRRIAVAVERHAPDGWLINFTNPAGLVTEALQETLGERAVGICDSPDHLCREVADALERPFDELAFDYAGLNHPGWLVSARQGGRDLLPGLLADDERVDRLPAAALFGAGRLRELGAVPNEYLFYYERPQQAIDGFRRAGATRAQLLAQGQGSFYDADPGDSQSAVRAWRRAVHARNSSYMAEARDGQPPDRPADDEDSPPTGGYEQAALAAMDALEGVRPQVLILDVANRGALPFLDASAVVEVPAMIDRSGVRPLVTGEPPPDARRLMATVKAVERLTIRASAEGSRSLAVEALALHPLVPSHAIAEQILAGYLERQPLLAALLA